VIHIRITVLSLHAGAVLAFLLGFPRLPRAPHLPGAAGRCNALYAVPSLAMFAVLVRSELLEDRTLVFALALYSLVILLRTWWRVCEPYRPRWWMRHAMAAPTAPLPHGGATLALP